MFIFIFIIVTIFMKLSFILVIPWFIPFNVELNLFLLIRFKIFLNL